MNGLRGSGTPGAMTINVYALLTPVVLLLVLAEFVYCLVRRKGF